MLKHRLMFEILNKKGFWRIDNIRWHLKARFLSTFH